MMDISEKYTGTVVTFNDITDRLEFESQLKEQNEKLEYYAYTDHMAGVLNRRTGLFTLEKKLALITDADQSLSICSIDIDYDAEAVIKSVGEELRAYDKKGLEAYKHAFSYGIVEVPKGSSCDLDDIIKRADQKMYQNKSLKKNKVDSTE